MKSTAALLLLGVPTHDPRAFSPVGKRMSLYDDSGGGDNGSDSSGNDVGAEADMAGGYADLAGVDAAYGGSGGGGSSQSSYNDYLGYAPVDPGSSYTVDQVEAATPGSDSFTGPTTPSVSGLAASKGGTLSADALNQAVETLSEQYPEYSQDAIYGMVTGQISAPAHSSGVSYADIAVAEALGMGDVGVSDSQTVDQAIAAQSVNSFISQNIGTLANVVAGPIAGTVVTAVNALANNTPLSTVVGQIAASLVGTAITQATGIPVNASTVTALANGQLGQTALSVGINAVAMQTGLPISTVTAIAKGNIGAAAANTVVGSVIGAVAQQMGQNPAVVGMVLSKSGVTSNLSGMVGSTINQIAAPLNNAISDITGQIASVSVPGGLDGLANAVNAIGGPAAVPTDGAADFSIAGSGSGNAGEQDAAASAAATSAVEASRSELESIAAIINGSAPYNKAYDYNNDGAVTRDDLMTRATQLAQAKQQASAPSSSDIYWKNLYSDLQTSLKVDKSAQMVTPQMIQQQYDDDLLAMVQAGFPSFDLEAYKKIYGLSSNTDALERFLDEGQFSGELTNNTEYQRAVEAVDLLLADNTQDESDLFAILDQYQLPESAAAKGLGLTDSQFNELVQSVDSRVTTGDEVIAYFESTMGRQPTIEELAQFQGKPEWYTQPNVQILADQESVTFDGSKYGSIEEAAAAALMSGYNNVSYGGKTLVLNNTTVTPKQQFNSPAASDIAFKQAYMSNVYDGSKAKSQLEAAIAASNNGDFRYTYNGKTWKVPENISTIQLQAAINEAEKAYAENELQRSSYEDDPPLLDTTDGAAIVQLQKGVQDAVTAYNAAAKSGDPNAIKFYLGKVTDAQAAYDAKKLEMTEKYSPANASNIGGISFGDRVDEFSGMDDAQLPAEYDNLKATINRGLGSFMQYASDFTYALTVDNDPNSDSYGKQVIDRNNAFYKMGQQLESEGNAALSPLAKMEESQILSAVSNADGWANKALAFFTAGMANPVGWSTMVGKEAVEELIPMALTGGVGRIAGYAAAMGTDMTMNVMESFGSTWGDTYDAALQQGMDKDKAMTTAMQSAGASTLATLLTSGVGDAAVVRALMGDVSGVTAAYVGKAALKEYVTEYTEGLAQNATQQYYLNGQNASAINWDQATAAAAIEAGVGMMVSSGIIGAAQGVDLAYNSVIGSDANGQPLTLDGFLTGSQTIGSMADVDFGADVGGGFRLGDVGALIAVSEPELLDSWALAMPQEFSSAVNNALSFDANEQADYLAERGLGGLGADVYSDAIADAKTQREAEQALESLIDPMYMDQQEAADYLQSQGYDGSPDEVSNLLADNGASVSEDDAKSRIDQYIDDHTVTPDELRDKLLAENPTLTDEQIAAYAASGAGVDQNQVIANAVAAEDAAYSNEQEVRDAYAAQGLADPTQADVDKFIGAVGADEMAESVLQNMDAARYNSLSSRIDATTEGVQNIVDTALTAQIEPLLGQLSALQNTVGVQANLPTVEDVTNALKVQSGKAEYDPKYDWNGDGVVEVSDALNILKSSLGKPTSEPMADGLPWGQPTGVYKYVADQIATLPTGADIDTAIRNALEGYATTEGVQNIVDTALEETVGTFPTDENPEGTGLIAELIAQGKTVEEIQAALGDPDAGTGVYKAINDAQQAGVDAAGAAKNSILEAIGEAPSEANPNGSGLLGDIYAETGQLGEQIAGVQEDVTDIQDLIGTASTEDSAGTGIIKTLEDLGANDAQIAGVIGAPAGVDDTGNPTEATGLYKFVAESSQSAIDAANEYLDDVIGTAAVEDDPNTPDVDESAPATGLMADIAGVEGRLSGQISEVQQTLGTPATEDSEATGFYKAFQDLGLTDQQILGIIGEPATESDPSTGLYKRIDDAQQAGLDATEALAMVVGQPADVEAGTESTGLFQILDNIQETQTDYYNDLTQQNQELSDLLGKPAQQVTQEDIDALTQMLSGEVDTNMAYDANQDGVINQADIDLLNEILAGTNADWQPPAESYWSPTGMYGELAGMQSDFTKQLADIEAQRVADQKAAEAKRMQDLARTRNVQTIQSLGELQNLANQAQQAVSTTTPIYGQRSDFDVFGAFDPLALSTSASKRQGSQSTSATNKMARGGIVANDSLEEFLQLLQS